MRITIPILGILLIALSVVPGFSQEIPAEVLPAIPEIATAAPEAPEAPAWTETVAPDVQITEEPGPIAAPAPIYVTEEPKQSSNWTEKPVNTVQFQMINREQDEFVTRMAQHQIFRYAPTDPRSIAAVPEPGSFVALAVGLSGMFATIRKRRVNS